MKSPNYGTWFTVNAILAQIAVSLAGAFVIPSLYGLGLFFSLCAIRDAIMESRQ